jgi:hypothetical protein
MILGFRKRFLFVHIPKCAGESITALLLKPPNGGTQFLRKHSTYRDAAQAMGNELEALTMFAVVRNPFAQVFSFYEHLRKPLRMTATEIEAYYPGSKGRIGPHWASLIAMRAPFAQFVEEAYGNPTGPDAWLQDLCRWVCDDTGRLAVPHLLRYETLGETFPSLAAQLGIEGELPWRNASRSVSAEESDYRAHYDSVSRQLIEARFKPSLETFGYGF